jgi:hypothetical protein
MGLEDPGAVVLSVAIFWDIVPSSPYVNRRFGGTYHSTISLATCYTLVCFSAEFQP